MSEWLDDARRSAEQGDYKRALKSLDTGLYARVADHSSLHIAAEEFSRELAASLTGRLQKKAERLAYLHQDQARRKRKLRKLGS
jgi:hypothetical protein